MAGLLLPTNYLMPDEAPVHSSSLLRKRSELKGSGINYTLESGHPGIAYTDFQEVTISSGRVGKAHREREAAVKARAIKLNKMRSNRLLAIAKEHKLLGVTASVAVD
jgi:hypothetical protein